jgi:O-antigen/teichoic acid export membrane protein
LRRFGHLLSAQGVDALLHTGFFLYLAWLDASAYGEVMYGMAAGAMVSQIVQYGLYYPLVSHLGENQGDSFEVFNRVNLIKLTLLVPAMAGAWVVTLYRGFSAQMVWVVLVISLGYALEALAETFFADCRVQGRQDREARAKMAGSLLGYGFGFAAAALGLGPVPVALFKVWSGLARLTIGSRGRLLAFAASVFSRVDWGATKSLFKAATVFALIDILGTLYNKTNIFFLESTAGIKGVAYYSATWNLVDPVSTLASQQFLGWVVFPLLAVLWWKDRDRAHRLVRANALWLMAVAFPIILILYVESDFLIGMIYPLEYRDAAWMQRYLVWTIILSFENNLFAYLMMVAGQGRLLLIFAIVATFLNLVFNITLVGPLGLAGGCLVIVLTKLAMTVLTFGYCQIHFSLFKARDLGFPLAAILGSLGLFIVLKPFIHTHAALLVVLTVHGLLIWKAGRRYLGDPTGGRSSDYPGNT